MAKQRKYRFYVVMRKHVLITSTLLIILFSALMHSPAAVETLGAIEAEAFDASRAHAYSLRVVLDERAHTFSGTVGVSYYNSERAAIKDAAFHLYANGYAAAAPMNPARYYPDGFEPGSTVLTEVTVGGERVTPRYINDDMLAVVPLLEPLFPGQRAQIELSFITRIPKNRTRFGHSTFGYNVTGAYPVAAVPKITYPENAKRPKLSWATHDYPAFGDPFFSSAASYDVTLTIPAALVVACTGSVVSESLIGEQKTLTIEAKGAREFAFCASSAFVVERANASGVEVELYALSTTEPASRKKALDAAKNAISVFSSRFGPHPFARLCVAESGMLDGGMEYPGLILIDTTLFMPGYERHLEYIVVHEAAHQWWYALVGSEQYTEPWLDEALTEYSARVYFGDVYGETRRKELFRLFENDAYSSQSPALPGGGALSDYPDAVLYSRSVYAGGAKMYEELRSQMGDGPFFAALREYAARYAYGLTNKQALFDILKRHGGDLGIVERFLG